MVNTSLIKSTIIISLMTCSFKILGFVKQAFIAYYYGANANTDVYFVAEGFIVGLSTALAKAFAVSLVACYAYVLINKGRKFSNILLSNMMTFFLPVSSFAAFLMFFYAPHLARLLAPAFTEKQYLSLVEYLKFLSPLVILIVIFSLLSAALDAEKKFIPARLHSLFTSIFLIAACVFLSKSYGLQGLIFAQYLSYLFILVIVFYSLSKNYKYSFHNPLKDENVFRVFRTAFPLIIGNATLQINQIVNKIIASGLDSGVVSSLSYAQVLDQFVTSVLLVNAGNLLFANFAILVAQNKESEVKDTLIHFMNVIIIIMVPISIITCMLSREIVSIVYLRGSFSHNAVKMTSLALIGYAIGFPIVAFRDILIKSMYAYSDTKTPMVNGVISILFNILFCVVLSKYIGVIGITLSSTIAALIAAVLSYFSFKKHVPDFSFSVFRNTFGKIILSGILSIIIIYSLRMSFSNNTSVIILFILLALVGFISYFTAMYFLKCEEVIFYFEKLEKHYNNYFIKK